MDQVAIADIRRIANLLLDHLESIRGPVVTLEQDYFWSIDSAERRDVYVEPTEPTIGQVSECWSNLQRGTTDPASALNYHLVCLGHVLESLGESSRRAREVLIHRWSSSSRPTLVSAIRNCKAVCILCGNGGT